MVATDHNFTSYNQWKISSRSVAVFNLEGGMGLLTPYLIKWPFAKTRVGHHLHYVNGKILGSVLFSS